MCIYLASRGSRQNAMRIPTALGCTYRAGWVRFNCLSGVFGACAEACSAKTAGQKQTARSASYRALQHKLHQELQTLTPNPKHTNTESKLARKLAGKQANNHTNKETTHPATNTLTPTHTQTKTQTLTHTGRQTDRQTDRRTDRQTDRQTNKQTKTHRNTHAHTRMHPHAPTRIRTHKHSHIETDTPHLKSEDPPNRGQAQNKLQQRIHDKLIAVLR